MLGWTTNLIGVVTLILLILVGYSLIDTLMLKQGIGFGEYKLEWDEENIHLLIPLLVNNTGLFPISNMVLTTNVSDCEGMRITGSETVLPHVREGDAKRETQTLRLSMKALISEKTPHLLFNDSQLRMDAAIRFTYAYLVSLKIQLPYTPLPWGAPLFNLSVGKPTGSASFNATHHKVNLPLNFENHAPITLEAVRLTLLNDQRESLASKRMTLGVGPMEGFADSFEIFIEERDLQRLTERGFVRLFFQTSEFSFGPVEIPYG